MLRRHEIDDAYRVDVVHRELPPVPPFCLSWEFPLMRVRDDLDPERTKSNRGGRSKKLAAVTLMESIAETTPQDGITISEWARRTAVKRQTLSEYLPDMRKRGWIATAGEGSSARQHITRKGLAELEKEAAHG
jgi:hypothetical protein